MKTLFLNCVLFTLKDREVAENKYIPVFNMWVSKLVENGGLGRDDFLLISIDERTIEYLKTTSGIMGTLLSYLKCPYAFKIFPAPATLLDGMRIRYTPHDFTQDAYMYLDIDVLAMKPLKGMLEGLEAGKVYTVSEGSLTDPNYGADMSSTEGVGYTSAVMVFTSPWTQEVLFKRVNELYRDKGYYTLDQPFYNHAVYMMPHDSRLSKYVSYNGHNYSKGDTILLNCGGDVGDGKIHFEKIHDIICLINIGFF